jgi:hypothetical protein
LVYSSGSLSVGKPEVILDILDILQEQRVFSRRFPLSVTLLPLQLTQLFNDSLLHQSILAGGFSFSHCLVQGVQDIVMQIKGGFPGWGAGAFYASTHLIASLLSG